MKCFVFRSNHLIFYPTFITCGGAHYYTKEMFIIYYLMNVEDGDKWVSSTFPPQQECSTPHSLGDKITGTRIMKSARVRARISFNYLPSGDNSGSHSRFMPC